MRVPSVTGRLAGVVVLLVVVLAGGWAYRWHRAGTVDDASTVWCLAADRQDALTRAGRALAVLRAESTVERLVWSDGDGSAEQWRQERTRDFARTCRALLGAEQVTTKDSSPWFGFAPSLLLAVLSAAVAAWFSRRQATAGARRAEADGLRTTAHAYQAAVERLLRDLEQPRPGLAPDDGEVQERRLELVNRLNGVAGSYRRWALPRELGERLDREPFNVDLPTRWYDQPQQRTTLAAQTRAALGRLEEDVAEVAKVMTEPGLFGTRVGRP